MRLTPEAITAYQRFDSRGRPTVMTRIELTDNNGRRITANAFVPSGASKGSREALELRDGGRTYHGLGVSKAVKNVSEIAQVLAGFTVTDQEAIDQRMIDLDGTENKSRLGANAILSVSLAVARAAAEYQQVPLFNYLAELYHEPNPNLLPTPLMNLINGGAHADNGLVLQELMIVLVGAANFTEAMKMGTEVYGTLGKAIKASGVGDEGGYSPIFQPSANGRERIYNSLALLVKAIELSDYKAGKDIAIALDSAASEFYQDGRYYLDSKTSLDSAGMVEFYRELIREFPVISIEDGMAEGDEAGWKALTNGFVGGRGIQIVGDDLFVTNPLIFQRGIERGLANAVLVKPNQIGTLSETLKVIRMAKAHGYNVVISHRSGETEDPFIAHLAVATDAGQIKTGAPARSERVVKYNEFLDIEQIHLPRLELTPYYAGRLPFKV
ncbi:phosphopyruvate hydratase [Candidatus Daviesbacteria bacterium]|nr:phosphopyruvate hydratase [Candidatus Daviesbacteria bacterium]